MRLIVKHGNATFCPTVEDEKLIRPNWQPEKNGEFSREVQQGETTSAKCETSKHFRKKEYTEMAHLTSSWRR